MPTHPALAILAARPDLFSRQGSVVASWRRRGTRIYGPYYRLAYRDAGRQKSIYLGCEDAAPVARTAPSLVEEVRRRLALRQTPRRRCRILDRLRRHISAALRIQKTKLNIQLRPLGLYLKGFEVRGWRTAPLRCASKTVHPITRRLPCLRQPRLHPAGPPATARKTDATRPSPVSRRDVLEGPRAMPKPVERLLPERRAKSKHIHSPSTGPPFK
jgi:hypothetical protein